MANFILDKRSHITAHGEPLRIFEIGGGTGTLARDILDHLKASVPDVYHTTEYVSVEISPQLAAVQERAVRVEGGHKQQYRVGNEGTRQKHLLCSLQGKLHLA
jgi:SAM-dependent MidA family methyltransferase